MARPPVSRTVDVLLVSLAPDVREISALLASAGHRIVETIVQRRDRPDTRTFVGRGKSDELRARADAGGSGPCDGPFGRNAGITSSPSPGTRTRASRRC